MIVNIKYHLNYISCYLKTQDKYCNFILDKETYEKYKNLKCENLMLGYLTCSKENKGLKFMINYIGEKTLISISITEEEKQLLDIKLKEAFDIWNNAKYLLCEDKNLRDLFDSCCTITYKDDQLYIIHDKENDNIKYQKITIDEIKALLKSC